MRKFGENYGSALFYEITVELIMNRNKISRY